jgi:hypothetical protein
MSRRKRSVARIRFEAAEELVVVRVLDVHKRTRSTEDAFEQARGAFADKERLCTVESEICKPVVLRQDGLPCTSRRRMINRARDGDRPEPNGRPLKPTILLPHWPLERLGGALVERTSRDCSRYESDPQEAVAPREERLGPVDGVDLGL